MEKRDKRAREASLNELRQLRKEGGTRLKYYRIEEEPLLPDSYEFAKDGAEDDVEDGIEYESEDDASQPKISSFRFRSKRVDERSRTAAIDTTVLKNDAFFNSLMEQLEMPSEHPSEHPPECPLENDAVIRQLESENWSDMDPQVLSSTADLCNNIDELGLGQQQQWAQAHSIEQFLESFVPPPPIAKSSGGTTTETASHKTLEIRFYWFDAYEKPNGTIYLFGKVQQDSGFSSCCVVVHNIKRNLFFLPREYQLDPATGQPTDSRVTLKDVHDEITDLAARFGISKFGCKRVSRRYAFEIPDIPVEADYVKMIYDFGDAVLPSTQSGRTFSNIFGTNTGALELFLLKRRIMGPCWLSFRSQARSNVSWCRVEVEVTDPKAIEVVLTAADPPPPLNILSLTLRTIINKTTRVHEVVSVSGLVFENVSIDSGSAGSGNPKCNSVFSVVREPENLGFPAKFAQELTRLHKTKLEITKNERALLSYLIAMIHRHDPDVLVGHYFLGFDLSVLLHRMRACRVDSWSRLGRLNWSQWPKAKPGTTEASFAERQIACGRLICDTYLSSKDLIKSKNYSLQQLAQKVLGVEREDFDYERVADSFGSPPSLDHLLRHAEMDGYYASMIMFQLMVLPLTKQLTSIAGNLWSRTLVGGRAERNEFLLLHEFHNAKFICPDKPASYRGHLEEEEFDDVPAKKGRKKPAYAGGLVLEPKKGFYDNIVLLLDFNSLYPSIIQEYNICFTSVERDYSAPETIPAVPDPGCETGLLPRILGQLVAKRRVVKNLMKDSKNTPHQQAQYHIRQQALKLTANSIYGCLGFSHSRFYAKPLAMLITSKGREILQSTVDLTQTQCKLDVIYGDTDSIMVYTGTRDPGVARKLAQQIKRAVNERYRLLEIEVDGMFEKLLLLKKKKYAALVMDELSDGTFKRHVEMKGLDLVRRDWSELSVDVSNFILDRIMHEEDREKAIECIHSYLQETAEAVINGKLPLAKFVISKNLTKDPEQYADAKTQPHVLVAIRMKQRGISVRAGDTIPYVICRVDTNGGALADRAFHPDEIKKDSLAITIDFEWYLAQQIHPPVARLCEHIEGTDEARLAACLGLDIRKYQHIPTDESMRLLSEEEKFRIVEKLRLVCSACHVAFVFEALILPNGNNGKIRLGDECEQCGARLGVNVIYYRLLQAIRRHLAEYHQGWHECDEPSCRTVTTRTRVYETRCVNEQCRGSLYPRISGQRLYHQLLYYRSLFNVDKQKLSFSASNQDEHVLAASAINEFEPVRALIANHLEQCSFPIISLNAIFAFAKASIKSR